MWTSRVRRFATRILPPGKLLPDRQPAYVASWIYVFGVGSLAAFGVVVVSGFALALGGPDWWHYNAVGHFFNSLHLWSVELFMALLVIHLWGKFWMAAWRGKRAWTWVTGVVAFWPVQGRDPGQGGFGGRVRLRGRSAVSRLSLLPRRPPRTNGLAEGAEGRWGIPRASARLATELRGWPQGWPAMLAGD